MRTIIEIALANRPSQTIQIPAESELLSAHMVFDVPSRDYKVTLWAIVDQTKPLEQAVINIVRNGAEMLDGPVWHYLGTSQTSPDVWHIFEVLM